ncbi:Colicin V production protein [Paraburkholderia atlantica]|uniref:Colicin V production protein n=1 Tax=Paraburkholderia atlantica TaxID=2654982 RepID=D5WEN2_PARAM|nr:CvpA family protein [Paraburkholderia atlantica]ADG19157.1 Colicin V production protein [Paraburkholderia atlantica]
MFTAFDYAVMAVIGLSALRGAWRGLLSEVFGLIGWIAAFFIACEFVAYVVPYIPSTWPGGALTQWLLAFALVAIGVVLVTSVVSALLSRLVQVTGLGGADRSLGLMFGLVRGVVLVLILVALAGLTELPKEEFWRNALLRPYAVAGVRAMKPLLPEALAAYVHVDVLGAPSNAQQDSGAYRLP